MKKIIVVGGVAGGASAAARLRRHSEEDRIIMFEKGPNVSFSNCCLPYHLSGIIETPEQLVLMQPEKFHSQYRIEARTSTEITSINRKKKEVVAKNLITGEEYTESYDKLVLSPGSEPIVPKIPGIEDVNFFTVRNVVDINKLNTHLKATSSKEVVIIGGGYIGIEVCENIKNAGYNVSLVEAANQVMRPFDYDMVQIFHKEIHDKGVNLILEDKVVAFEKDVVVLESGKKLNASTVVLAIGVAPKTELAKNAGLEIGKTGGIKTNQNYQTTDKDIYAVGDAIQVYGALFKNFFKLPLAGPAQKQARAVADHINGITVENRGFIGSAVIKVFEYNGASTGLTEGFIAATGMKVNYGIVWQIPNDSVGLMPSAKPAHFKMLYEIPTGKILGAQAIGKGNVDKRIDVIATAIKFGGTINDLKDLELCYAPPFSTAKDVVNFAGYIGSDLMASAYEHVSYANVRKLVENGSCIIDVREVDEFEEGHIKSAINIPLSQFRDRIDEIPKDKPIYLHCRSGQRSYNAALIMGNLGYNNTYNIAGGFMGLSFYEYFNDKTKNREPILTNYNFN